MEHVSKMTLHPLAIAVTVHILPQTHLKSLQYVLVALYNYAPNDFSKANYTFFDLHKNFVDDIVTEVSPLINFYVAENYHHNYFANNPNNPYCAMVVSPKISKTRAKHASLYE